MIPFTGKKIEKLMKQLGVRQEELEAEEVVIKQANKKLVIKNPTVVKVNFQGVETLQITGDIEEQALEKQREQPDFLEQDIKTVSEKANVDEKTAKKALEKTNGDLAEAIMMLRKGQ